MTFSEQLINSINNCYTNDPGFFWGIIIFLIITGCGLYLTIPAYRKIIGTKYFFQLIALLIFVSLAFLITLPIFIIEQILLYFDFAVKPPYTWVYIPVPILSAIILKRVLKLNYEYKSISTNKTGINNQIKKSGIKRKKTKTEIFLLLFFTFFAGICVMCAVNAVIPFINPAIEEAIILFIGLMVILGIIAATVIKILNVFNFLKERF